MLSEHGTMLSTKGASVLSDRNYLPPTMLSKLLVDPKTTPTWTMLSLVDPNTTTSRTMSSRLLVDPWVGLSARPALQSLDSMVFGEIVLGSTKSLDSVVKKR